MNSKYNIILMYIIVFLQGFVFYGPVATLYRQARGLSMYQIFLLESVFFILAIVFEVPWGWIADRYGYKLVLVASNLLFFISKIVFYEAYSFYTFMAEAIIVSIAISGLSGCDTAFLYNASGPSDPQKVFGRYNAFSTAGFLLASLVSSLVVSVSLDLTSFYTIIPYGLAAILTFFLKDNKVKAEKSPTIGGTFKNLLSNRRILIFVFSIALIGEIAHSVGVFLNQPQYIRSGIKPQYFGILMAVMQVLGMASAKSYKLSRKIGKVRSIGILTAVIAASCFLLAVFSSPISSVLLITAVSGSIALIQPISTDIKNSSINTGDRATMLSMYAMCGNIIAALLNLLIGKAADKSVETSFFMCGVISLLALFTLLLFGLKHRGQICEPVKEK